MVILSETFSELKLGIKMVDYIKYILVRECRRLIPVKIFIFKRSNRKRCGIMYLMAKKIHIQIYLHENLMLANKIHTVLHNIYQAIALSIF